MVLTSISNLLGQKLDSQPLVNYINELSSTSTTPSTPEIKSYPDVVYYNYYSFGVSFLFKPVEGYKPRADITPDKLILESLDIYNIPEVSTPDIKAGPRLTKKAEVAFSTYPVSPVTLNLREGKEFHVTRQSNGKDFVENLGEPDRKGGGSGPASGSIGIWCEWTKHGILVEFGGVEAIGPQAWERGKDAVWKVITVFPSVGE